MWFFMNTCYLMSILSFVLLIIAFFQSFLGFLVFQANHITFIILTSIVYLFTETLVIFFFVGTGVSIKEYTQEHKLKPDYHKKSIAIKREVYPPQLLNMLMLMILFIMVGAVDVGKVSVWIYRGFFVVCLIHFIKAKIIQHNCFRKNTENILDMSGIKLQN